MAKLRISTDFTLPIEAVTQTFAILAKRGVGKTYLASVMAEEMLTAKQQVVFIDPVGSCWGLKSGFPIAVFGGEHGDVLLEETSGEVIARAITENRFSAVLDLSLLRKGASIRFMTAFAETMYRLNREPVHLFIDEADAFAPQGRSGYGPQENMMLGAIEDIVRRGRKRGIGCTLITQRPAVLNKSVLTQCEVLVAMRLVHPLDIKAVMEWVNVHGEPSLAKEMTASLPELPIGSAWFWSPGWGNFFERVAVRKRETFDSSATPKPGEVQRQPKSLKPVDLDALGQAIKATVEKAKADDPKALRARIAELEKLLKAQPAATKTVEVEKRVEVPVLKDSQLDRTEKLAARMAEISEQFTEATRQFCTLIAPAFAPKLPTAKAITQPVAKPVQVIPKTIPRQTEPHGDLTGPEQRILDALAWMEAIGIAEPEQPAVAFLAGYTIGGGAWNNPRGRLRTRGLIDYRGDRLTFTDDGRALANQPSIPLTSEGLQAAVMERLPGPERKILQVLIEAYPSDIDKAELAQRSGYSEGGGAFNNPCGRLRTLGLIDYTGKGRAVARGLLFPC